MVVKFPVAERYILIPFISILTKIMQVIFSLCTFFLIKNSLKSISVFLYAVCYSVKKSRNGHLTFDSSFYNLPTALRRTL